MSGFGFARSFRCMAAMEGPGLEADGGADTGAPVVSPAGSDGCFGVTVETYRVFGLGLYAYVDTYAMRRDGTVQVLAPEEVTALQRAGVLAERLPPKILMPHETTQGFNFWGLVGIGLILWFVLRLVSRGRRRMLDDPRWTDDE